MNTYNVTGTYSYGTGEYQGSGQGRTAVIAAPSAAVAAHQYREGVLVPLAADRGGYLARGYACAVNREDPADVHTDPLDGVELPHASRLAMRLAMPLRALRAAAGAPFRFGLATLPPIPGRSTMDRRALAIALDTREEVARLDVANWELWANYPK